MDSLTKIIVRGVAVMAVVVMVLVMMIAWWGDAPGWVVFVLGLALGDTLWLWITGKAIFKPGPMAKANYGVTDKDGWI